MFGPPGLSACDGRLLISSFLLTLVAALLSACSLPAPGLLLRSSPAKYFHYCVSSWHKCVGARGARERFLASSSWADLFSILCCLLAFVANWNFQSGHIARECQNPRLEGDDRQVINKARAQYRRCFNCGKMGHISADCTRPAGNKACYNCGKEGHIAKDCPNPRSGGE